MKIGQVHPPAQEELLRGEWVSLEDDLKGLEQAITATEKPIKQFDPQEFKDRTRSRIANWFVIGFFILIASVFIISLGYNMWLLSRGIENVDQYVLIPKDLILTVTSAIGTPLGFVVGYYFKGLEKEEKNA